MRRVKRLALDLITLVFLLLLVAPLGAILLMSLQSEADLLLTAKTLTLGSLTFENYAVLTGLREGRVMAQWALHFPRAFLNSLAVAVPTAFLCVGLASLAAYSVARLRWRGSGAFVYAALITRMVPEIALIIPLFFLFRRLGLLNSLQGLIISEVGLFLPLAIFILRAFIVSIPEEIEEAAQIDGCSRLGAFLRVTLPLSAPGVAACSVIVFLFSWHMLVIPLVIASSPSVGTLPVLLVNALTDVNIRYTQSSAFIVISLLPTVVLTIALNRYVVAGLTAGSMKG